MRMKCLSRVLRRKMSGILENTTSQCDFMNNVRSQSRNSAILHYEPGEERFKLKIIRNGKLFNFDRSVTDTVKVVKDRITTNITKKVKNFDGSIKLFVCEQEVFDNHMQDILDNGLKKLKVLSVQIGEDVFDVDFNPPEISKMKFLKSAMVGFPIFPVNIETTKNFILKESNFSWEIVKEKQKKSKKAGDNVQVGEVETSIHSQFVYFPTEADAGKFLRFTCTPSDGHRFGVPIFVETESPVQKPPVADLICHDILSRLDPKKENLRVVTYNALADTYATPEWFSFSPAASLEIDYRLPLLNKEIISYDGDIVCLQEVDARYYEGNFEPFLTLHGNYQGAFSCKVGNTREGTATFFKKDKFALISSEKVVILDHMKTLPMWTSVLSKNEALVTRLEDRNTVLQVNVVEYKSNPDLLLVVANTHLYFHPNADHIRLIQTITCVDYIESTIKKLEAENPSKTITLFLCGDFNCTPPFSSVRLLASGSVKSDDEDWISHEPEKLIPGIDFKHDLKLTRSHAGEELTNITMQFEGCIDYIFYQSDIVKLCKAYSPPDKDTLAVLTETTPAKVSLPNFRTPSDHLPLIADFILPKN